jgi:hypothetical protein
MTARSLWLPVAALVLLAGACATTPKAKTPPSVRASDYYPLAVGNSWTYKVTPSAPDGQDEMTIEILAEEAGRFTLNVGGTLEARPTGVTDGQRYLIEEPVEVGHEWISVPAPSAVERYKIVETGVKVSLPAGTFKDCVRVSIEQELRTRDGVPGKLVGTWTFAKGIGPIHFVQDVTVGNEEPRRNIEYKLYRYHLAPTGGAS